jgi:hypothetical protein
LSGSPNETIDLSKRIQAVNTLEKMLRREVSDTDKEYFLKLATCMFSALFSKKSLDERATGIELLSREIGEEGHFAEMVAGMRASVAGDATRNWPELFPVGTASDM